MKNGNKRFLALSLALVASCSCVVTAAAADTAPAAKPITADSAEKLAESVLYYGTVKEILKDDKGAIEAIQLESERYGEYVMNVSKDTVWIDSGKKAVSDGETLKAGEGIYVFHSMASTRSMPPQSAAYAVVRNVPQDAACAAYMTVDQVLEENGSVKILADKGAAEIVVTDKTTYSPYLTKDAVSLKDIQSGSRIMVWTADKAEEKQADHVMLLPEMERLVTRGQLVTALYEAAGKPETASEAVFNDMEKDSPLYAAAAWAQEKGYVIGYSTGSFGADDTVSREQMITILWRYAGSPVLMDYTGLSAYEDVEDVSKYAMQAMMWAHQQGHLEHLGSERLGPKDGVMSGEMGTVLKSVLKK